MIKNRYTISESQMTDFYTLVSKEYFARLRKIMMILTVACAAGFAFVQIYSLKQILLGMAVSLLIVTLAMPKLQKAKIRMDVNSTLDQYRRVYQELPTQEICVQGKTITVETGKDTKNVYSIEDMLSVRNNDKMIALEFPQNQLICLMADGYDQGDAREVMQLIAREGFTKKE